MKGRVLVVAGSDSGGGAGIQADIKTITALNAYAATAVTALTAQNTFGVVGTLAVPAEFVRRQIDAVLDDIGADCIKTGMLADRAIVAAVADALERRPQIPLVLDPVMVSSSGTRLLDVDAVDALKRRLVTRARLITPNLAEAEVLTGDPVATLGDMRRAADRLLKLGAAAVMVTGGHLAGGIVQDLVAEAAGEFLLEAPRIASRATHGTGCTLASAIAAGLAQGLALRDAIARAHAYVRRAIETAPGFGGGSGPLNHAHPFESH